MHNQEVPEIKSSSSEAAPKESKLGGFLNKLGKNIDKVKEKVQSSAQDKSAEKAPEAEDADQK